MKIKEMYFWTFEFFSFSSVWWAKSDTLLKRPRLKVWFVNGHREEPFQGHRWCRPPTERLSHAFCDLTGLQEKREVDAEQRAPEKEKDSELTFLQIRSNSSSSFFHENHTFLVVDFRTNTEIKDLIIKHKCDTHLDRYFQGDQKHFFFFLFSIYTVQLYWGPHH